MSSYVEASLAGLALIRRLLTKRPAAAVLIVAICGVGIGVACAILSVVDAVLVRPLPYRDADRLVAIGHRATRADLPLKGISNGIFLYYRSHSEAFEDIGTYQVRQSTFIRPGEPERVRVVLVSPSVLSTVAARPM